MLCARRARLPKYSRHSGNGCKYSHQEPVSILCEPLLLHEKTSEHSFGMNCIEFRYDNNSNFVRGPSTLRSAVQHQGRRDLS